MAKLPTAAHSPAAERDLWLILRQWLKFHFVVTFPCQVTLIFVKVFLCCPWQIRTFRNGFEKWIEKCDKILLSVKEICSGDCEVDAQSIHWWGTAWRFYILQSSIRIRSSSKTTAALLPHVGQPLSICTEEMVNTIAVVVREVLLQITVRHLAQTLDISKLCVHIVLCEKLKMQKVAACWVIHLQTSELWDGRIKICREWLKRIEDEPDMMERLTSDENSWIHRFDPATKQESLHIESLHHLQ